MDIGEQGTRGKTQLVVDNSNVSVLHNDDSNVRKKETGMTGLIKQPYESKSLNVSCAEARVVAPRDDDEMHNLNAYFANLNPKSPISPQSPPNLDVHSRESGPFSVDEQLDGKPRSSLPMMKAIERLDARCDPKAIPFTTTHAWQPTETIPHATTKTFQPTDSHGQVQPCESSRFSNGRQPSQVQVVTSQAEQKEKLAEQIRQLALNNDVKWKQALIQKLIKQYQKSKTTVPVSPDNDIENQMGYQKEKPKTFTVQVVEDKVVEEDMTITISDSSDSEDNFCDIRPQQNTPPQELRTLNCQPSDDTDIQHRRLALPFSSKNGQTYLRTHEYLKGCVLPGTQTSMSHLLSVYSQYPAEFAIGCHGILLRQDNIATELGEYEEVISPNKGHTFIRLAGKGSYGSVKLCTDNLTRKEFVKKEVFKVDKMLLYEVRILNELNHTNITRLNGFILRDGFPEILMEYAGVSLLEYTCLSKCEEDTNEKNIIEMLYQGLCGLQYLDQMGVIHYDIKPENICILTVSSGIILKITDFGSAKKVTEPPDFIGCTVEYLSPELAINLINCKYQTRIPFGIDVTNYVMTPKSDVYALALSIMFVYRKGHVVISLFNEGKMTYAGVDPSNLNRIRQTILISLAKNPAMVKNMLIPDEACSEMKSVLKEMVEESPHVRPSAKDMKDKVDYLLRKQKTPTQVPVFLSLVSYTEEKRRSLIRQLSSRNNMVEQTGHGPIRQLSRRYSRDQSVHPYRFSGQKAQKMDTSDVEVDVSLQNIVPKFSQF